MKRTIFIFLLAITWPSTQALFTVTSEQDSYDGELHKKITMGCRFSPVEKSQISQLSVIWQRVEPLPVMEVYRLEKGVEIRNVTDGQFQNRAQLLKDELKKFRAVLELFPLQISDSGTYQCIVKHKEADYKKTTLTVRAPYRPVRKNIRRLNNEEVELSCESQGFPLAHVDWSEEELTRWMNNTSEKTSEGTYKLTSRVTVTGNVIKNYTCSFMEEKKTGPSATFNIPGEIPVRSNWSHGYAAVGVISVMCLGLAVTSLFLHWRRKGQKNKGSMSTVCITSEPNLTVTSADFLIPKKDAKPDSFSVSSEVCGEKVEKLREVLMKRYAELDTSELRSGFTLICGEAQFSHLQPLIPGPKQTVLLEGREGSGKSSVSRTLASSWAKNVSSGPVSLSGIRLVILVNFEGADGDFFQVVRSNIPSEADLETADVKNILLGNTDSLLLLDGYRKGDREVDETLVKFLKERSSSRVLITARPGQLSSAGEVITRIFQLHTENTQTENS
ncbi:selection and upkeep of intraepithelial T-cells protein 5-like [Astyanax mexicanus]|uniref:Selection and upkeep of intraepithelial T-cells protein 5-like n=1 Tax=Astyanax mexicanus TaxID=7994 RepID=A0A8T2L346_ASTMX|nr:selection and upkeep of intraepithelial T-cells protein 5-like [Astyanax mexicanus]